MSYFVPMIAKYCFSMFVELLHAPKRDTTCSDNCDNHFCCGDGGSSWMACHLLFPGKSQLSVLRYIYTNKVIQTRYHCNSVFNGRSYNLNHL